VCAVEQRANVLAAIVDAWKSHKHKCKHYMSMHTPRCRLAPLNTGTLHIAWQHAGQYGVEQEEHLQYIFDTHARTSGRMSITACAVSAVEGRAGGPNLRAPGPLLLAGDTAAGA
jgi:hypothetical protein